MPDLIIRPFQPTDQAPAQAIILAGMEARWGFLDHSLNQDLHDIQHNYVDVGNYFFVAELEGEMVATCALTHEAQGVARIERMSVKQEWWGQGFGRKLTTFLINFARDHNYKEVVVETQTVWTSAINLYKTIGFQLEFIHDGETHMRLGIFGK